MSNYQTDVTKLIGRCRRIGWGVESRQEEGIKRDWEYRITCPDGWRIQIHNTPRNAANAIAGIMRDLDAHGFADAEAAWLAKDKADKAQKLKEQREAARIEAERLAKQAERQAQALAKAAGPYRPQPIDLAWAMTPAPFPETRYVVIDREAAEKLLTINTYNRKRSDDRVAYFVGLITADPPEFGCTHQGGATDWNGVLQDGQSRLEAIVETDTPVVMQWSVGMDPENFKRVDTGKNRSGRDTAGLRGLADPGIASTAAKMLAYINDHGPDAHVKASHGRMSNDRLDRALIRYGEELEAAIIYAKLIKRDVKKANASALACAIYLIRTRLPKDDPRCARFFEDIHEGNLPRTDVVWKLRQMLMNGQDGRAYNSWSALALILKTWNHRNAGRSTSPVWRPKNEPFPCHIFLPAPIVEGQEEQQQAA